MTRHLTMLLIVGLVGCVDPPPQPGSSQNTNNVDSPETDAGLDATSSPEDTFDAGVLVDAQRRDTQVPGDIGSSDGDMSAGPDADAGDPPDFSGMDAAVDMPAEPTRIVLVVNDAEAGETDPLFKHLENRGFAPELVPESSAPTTDAPLVIVAQTVSGGGSFSSNLAVAWNAIDVPMLLLDPQSTDELGTTISYLDRHALANRTNIDIVDGQHPSMAGLSGTVEIFPGPTQSYCFSAMLPDAVVLANVDATDLGVACEATAWVLPAGGLLLDDSTRSTPRLGLMMGDGAAYGSWNDNAWALFDASTDWLLDR